MSATVHGTAFFYGIDTTNPTNLQILSISKNTSDANEDTVTNSSGQVITLRTDDQVDELSVECAMETDFAEDASYAIGTKVTIAGGRFAGDYRLKTKSESKQAKGWAVFRCTLVKNEYLTLS